MPAPRRGANQSGSNAHRTPATSDNTIDISDPQWNTSLAKLPPFLAALKRNDWLFNQVKDALSLVTRGYVVDSKHKKIVASWQHLKHVIDNPHERMHHARSGSWVMCGMCDCNHTLSLAL